MDCCKAVSLAATVRKISGKILAKQELLILNRYLSGCRSLSQEQEADVTADRCYKRMTESKNRSGLPEM